MFRSSEPLIRIKSAPNSLHNALATVVLPTPEVPHNNRFGISLLFTKSKNIFFVSVGRTQVEIFLGLYLSTHRNSYLIV